MCPSYAAARPPAATRVPLGDTSGEGDTTGAGGHGDPTADPPVSEGPRASSHTSASPEADDGEEDDAENEEETPADHPGIVSHGNSSDTPDDAAILPKTRTVASTDSAGMHALGAMACRFLTEREAKRLDDQKALPLPDMDSRGDVQAPSRLVFSVDPSTLGRTRLVGVPALQDHQLQDFHIRDGYGGLESLIQVEELDHADMLDLREFFSDNNPVVADLILSSRANTAPGDELESSRHSVSAQREMATLLSEYGVDRLAERTFSTVSVLRRVLDRYRRVCHQLDASPSQSRQDALRAQDQLHAAKLFYEFDRAHWESERQQSADAATYTAERYQDDVKELVHEHNANKRGLQEEVSKLRQELEDSQAYQRILDRRVRESRFDVTDLMNFLGNHATLACNWVRLRDLLQHYQDRTPVPQDWHTVIATTASDDPLSQPGAFTGLDPPDNQDGESKQEDNPDSSPSPSSKRRSSRRRSSGSFSTPSDSKRNPKRSSHKVPAAPQLRPLERVEDSSSCLPEGTPPVWSVEKARGSLPGPIVWDDLRLDDQRLMCSGIFLKGAVSWLQEDRPAHTRFCQDDLVDMLSRMMFWNKLNESHWPKYVPERYYLAAEAHLDDMEGQKMQPLFWGNLSATGDTEEELLPEDFEPEQDDKSKDADWNAADEGVPVEDVSEVESVSESVTTSKRLKRRGSQTPSADQPPTKRPRGGSRSLLAQNDYSELTPAENAMMELPDDGMASWRHHGIRVKHADPSSTKNSQTLGFSAYSPNRHDLDLLKARFNPEAFHHLQTQVLPWRQMYDDRVKELYFHRLEDLSAAEVTFLDQMVDFMNGNSRAFWNALHWIMFLPGDVDSLGFKLHTRRRRAQESVNKRAATLAKRHKRNGVRESLFHEPGVWKYPAKVCHWILEDPSALQSHSLEEQLRRLDIAEPARLQWAHCASDDDRIAHVPAEIRDMLIPAGQRDLISDAAP